MIRLRSGDQPGLPSKLLPNVSCFDAAVFASIVQTFVTLSSDRAS